MFPDARGGAQRDLLFEKSLQDMRADLPSAPWRRECPSIMRRIAIVVVAAVVVTLSDVVAVPRAASAFD
jgi:hypothetical protein